MAEDLDELVSFLKAGGVVAALTESTFGLLADALNPEGLEKVFALKRREPQKSVSLLIPTREHWAALVFGVPPLAEFLAECFWPGPFTIALPSAPGIDARLTVRGTVGVRVPGPSPAAALATQFGGPLTATSANLAGEPPCLSSDSVNECFPEALADGRLRVLPGKAHPPVSLPSTVVTIQDRTYSLAREGAVSADRLAAAFSSWAPRARPA